MSFNAGNVFSTQPIPTTQNYNTQQYAQPQPQPQPQPQQPDEGIYIPPYVVVPYEEYAEAIGDHHTQYFRHQIITPVPTLSFEYLLSRLPIMQIEERYRSNPPAWCRRVIPQGTFGDYYYRVDQQNQSGNNQNHQNLGDQQNHRGKHQDHRGNNQNHHGNDRYTQNTQQPSVSNPQDFQTPGSFEYNTYPSAASTDIPDNQCITGVSVWQAMLNDRPPSSLEHKENASQAMLRPIMDDSEVQPPTTETGRDRDLTKTELTLWQDKSISRDILRIAFRHRDEIRKNMFAIVPVELISSNLQAEPAVLQYIKLSAQEEAERRFFEIKQMDMKMTQSC